MFLIWRYYVYEKESESVVKRFFSKEKAIDLCAQLNTAAYFNKSSLRYDVADTKEKGRY